MTGREGRRPGGGFNPDRLAQRLEERDDALRERIEQLFDGVDKRLARIERDAASGAIERHNLAAEMAEVRLDLGEGRAATAMLREELERHVQTAVAVVEVAAEVAAVATASADVQAETVLQKLAASHKWLKGTAWGVMFGGVCLVVTEGPAVVRFVNAGLASVAAFWKGLGG